MTSCISNITNFGKHQTKSLLDKQPIIQVLLLSNRTHRYLQEVGMLLTNAKNIFPRYFNAYQNQNESNSHRSPLQ